MAGYSGATQRRRELKDTQIKALKPASVGLRYEEPDTEVSGLRIRVTDKGTKTFILYVRYPGSKAPARRALGEYGELTLEQARVKAREWKAQIKRGVDPRGEEERQRAAEQRRRANTFAAVAEDFIEDKLARERKGRETERDIRNNLLPAWGGVPVTDITDEQIAALITRKAKTAPAQARNLLGTAKRLFQWAVDRRAYGIKASPAAGLKPASLCGEKVARDRLLSEDEVRAFWQATSRLAYPYREAYRLLLLTGLRLNEVADASWPEFDPAVVRALKQRAKGQAVDWSNIETKRLVWVIPASRMKGRESKARAHAVPLTAGMLDLLETLPLFAGGDFLFSTSAGKSPVWISDKVKKDLDARMVEALREMATRSGDEPDHVSIEPWTNHDLRRVVRSGLSRLKIAEEVREAVLAHVRPGIKKTYDVHDYLDEKREALEFWNARLRSIVEPPSENVVPIGPARAAS